MQFENGPQRRPLVRNSYLKIFIFILIAEAAIRKLAKSLGVAVVL